MPQRNRLPAPAAALFLSLISCSIFSPSQTPTPTQLPATITPTHVPLPSPTPSPIPSTTPAALPRPDCDANRELEALRGLVDYEEFTVVHNTFQGERTLVLWFVEPALDPLAKGEAISENLELAIVRALALSHRLTYAQGCLEELFDVINPIVVDRDHNGWFSAKIPPSFLPRSAKPSQEELLAVKFDSGYLRQVETPKSGRQPPAGGSCSWPEARRKARMHFAPSRPNVDFYLVIDEVGVNVWAQWDAPLTPLDGEMASPLNIAMEVGCLQPALDWLWLFVVADDGTITFLGRIPGDAVRSEDYTTQVITQMEVLFP